MKKTTSLKKPQLDLEKEALKFASEDTNNTFSLETPKYGIKKTPNVAPIGSGLIPDGDVRLTANIRQDLHLKLKITAANQRTTIGEILEELINKHL